jgi:amino-acid N-acetyltransferase
MQARASIQSFQANQKGGMSVDTKLLRNPSLTSVRTLLEAANLPTSDLTEAHLEHFFACGPASALNGLIGIEIYNSDALLRSLVVNPTQRTRGLGSALVSHIERYARERGVSAIYLLTTTARDFFLHLGYRSMDRATAPQSIRATPEFSTLCPASSAFLVKQLVE